MINIQTIFRPQTDIQQTQEQLKTESHRLDVYLSYLKVLQGISDEDLLDLDVSHYSITPQELEYLQSSYGSDIEQISLRIQEVNSSIESIFETLLPNAYRIIENWDNILSNQHEAILPEHAHFKSKYLANLIYKVVTNGQIGYKDIIEALRSQLEDSNEHIKEILRIMGLKQGATTDDKLKLKGLVANYAYGSENPTFNISSLIKILINGKSSEEISSFIASNYTNASITSAFLGDLRTLTDKDEVFEILSWLDRLSTQDGQILLIPVTSILNFVRSEDLNDQTLRSISKYIPESHEGKLYWREYITPSGTIEKAVTIEGLAWLMNSIELYSDQSSSTIRPRGTRQNSGLYESMQKRSVSFSLFVPQMVLALQDSSNLNFSSVSTSTYRETTTQQVLAEQSEPRINEQVFQRSTLLKVFPELLTRLGLPSQCTAEETLSELRRRIPELSQRQDFEMHKQSVYYTKSGFTKISTWMIETYGTRTESAFVKKLFNSYGVSLQSYTQEDLLRIFETIYYCYTLDIYIEGANENCLSDVLDTYIDENQELRFVTTSRDEIAANLLKPEYRNTDDLTHGLLLARAEEVCSVYKSDFKKYYIRRLLAENPTIGAAEGIDIIRQQILARLGSNLSDAQLRLVKTLEALATNIRQSNISRITLASFVDTKYDQRYTHKQYWHLAITKKGLFKGTEVKIDTDLFERSLSQSKLSDTSYRITDAGKIYLDFPTYTEFSNHLTRLYNESEDIPNLELELIKIFNLLAEDKLGTMTSQVLSEEAFSTETPDEQFEPEISKEDMNSEELLERFEINSITVSLYIRDLVKWIKRVALNNSKGDRKKPLNLELAFGLDWTFVSQHRNAVNLFDQILKQSEGLAIRHLTSIHEMLLALELNSHIDPKYRQELANIQELILDLKHRCNLSSTTDQELLDINILSDQGVDNLNAYFAHKLGIEISNRQTQPSHGFEDMQETQAMIPVSPDAGELDLSQLPENIAGETEMTAEELERQIEIFDQVMYKLINFSKSSVFAEKYREVSSTNPYTFPAIDLQVENDDRLLLNEEEYTLIEMSQEFTALIRKLHELGSKESTALATYIQMADIEELISSESDEGEPYHDMIKNINNPEKFKKLTEAYFKRHQGKNSIRTSQNEILACFESHYGESTNEYWSVYESKKIEGGYTAYTIKLHSRPHYRCLFVGIPTEEGGEIIEFVGIKTPQEWGGAKSNQRYVAAHSHADHFVMLQNGRKLNKRTVK